MVITPEVLAGPPYLTAHINRLREYTLDFEREVLPLDFDRISTEIDLAA